MSVFHRKGNTRKAHDCAAIFVHAGAGYHSIQNESVHLKACNDAAVAAMAVLRNGGSAVDAVEIAIKVLEDREITNAGYGSNLAIDGVVEGDAVMVDHLGRSGGVGAVAQIKNPISLARAVLDMTTQELTLRRVPPNLLVGQGATDFAFQQGLPVLPHDALVSPAAKERWTRWKHDLRTADRRARRTNKKSSSTSVPTPTPTDPPPDYEEDVRNSMRREHTRALRAGMWNEGQPVSPPTPATEPHSHIWASPGSRQSSIDSRATTNSSVTPSSDAEETRLTPTPPFAADDLYPNSQPANRNTSLSPHLPSAQDSAGDLESGMRFEIIPCGSKLSTDTNDDNEGDEMVSEMRDDSEAAFVSEQYDNPIFDDDDDDDDDDSSQNTLKLPSLTPSPPGSPADRTKVCLPASENYPQDGPVEFVCPSDVLLNPPGESQFRTKANMMDTSVRDDYITDTVGAIAIDSDGNIACGASSGGIGMKFRGRVGPAALVGVGAAVVPADSEDKTRTSTGVVTSGTGEHIATTLAAKVCAERLYQGQRKRKGGGFENCEDDQAVRTMIEYEFMEHPSVRKSHSTGAIGVLAVKKTAYGAYLYFAHNTDSFALASMHADEPKPTCTMSRSHGNGMVAQGGRAIRFKRKW